MQQPVLVIDDSPDIHRLLKVRLAEENVTLLAAMSGRDGIEVARQQQPDLILLDVGLPDLGGFDVCRQLKADVETRSIPVIFLTGASDTVNKVTGLDLGAVDYIVKPFDVAELRARVRAALRTVRYQKLLAQQAQLDGLTGLWNRVYLDTRLREMLSACVRYERRMCVAMLDVDHFKGVNDRYGHPFGDRVLEFVADTLRGNTRLSDVPCRYGGEEFAILFPDTDLMAATGLCDRLRARIAEHKWRQRQDDFVVTVSIGVASGPEETDLDAAAERIIREADEALYTAKQSGRNRVLPAGCAGSVPADVIAGLPT